MPAHASSPAPVTPTSTLPAITSQKPRRWRLRDARVRTKLGLILLVPLLAIVPLATLRLLDAVDRAGEADLVRALATVAVQAGELGQELHRERIDAVRLLTDRTSRGGGADEPGRFNRQAARTDDAIDRYQAAVVALDRVPDVAATRLHAIDAQLQTLASLRQQIASDPTLTTSGMLLRYQAMLLDLSAYQATLPAVITDAALAEQTRAVTAIATAAGHAADADAIARTAALTGSVLTAAQAEALRASQTGLREAFLAFAQTATPAQRDIVDRAITGANVDTAEAAVTALLTNTVTGVGEDVGSALSGLADITRYVTGQLYHQLLAALADVQATVLTYVIIEATAVTITLAAAILVAVLLARLLATALRRLRAAAVHVAHTELPAAVARLADPQALADATPAQLAGDIAVPDRLRSRDEIGDVADALYDVHRTAIHLAGEQALLRTSLSTMFVNLARRSQHLVDAIITRLDHLQADERDPGKLQQMMALDSLATRMRRNDENLLVLAGADSSPPRTRDALIVDVLRAAQSEIEQFHRIEFGTVDDDVHIRAAAINDVVRLVAELLDNATRFSAPTTPVVVEARRLGHQLVIHIEDHGVGLTPEGQHAINTVLAQPRQLDIAAVRQMGVAVVARLAARAGIHVHIQGQRHHGTIATIAVPPTALILPGGRHHALSSPNGPEFQHGPTTSPAVRPAGVARHRNGRRSTDHIGHTGQVPMGQPDATVTLPVLDGQLLPPVGRDDAAGSGVNRPGLPKRIPQAQNPGPTETSPPPVVGVPVPRRPPEQTRDRLAAYQDGIQRARANHRPHPTGR